MHCLHHTSIIDAYSTVFFKSALSDSKYKSHLFCLQRCNSRHYARGSFYSHGRSKHAALSDGRVMLDTQRGQEMGLGEVKPLGARPKPMAEDLPLESIRSETKFVLFRLVKHW